MEVISQHGCVFCDFFTERSKVILETDHFFATRDNFPVNQGHTLIMPKRHCADIFSLNTTEWTDLPDAIRKVKSALDQEFHPDGYNIGANCGVSAGQTIFHAHIHIIPRYEGDVPDPRGGIRNFKKSIVSYDHHIG